MPDAMPPANLPPSLPAADSADIASRWQRAISSAAPPLADSAARLLARISPPHWALEWSLPYWLGQRLGLQREAWLNLTLGNVFGLAYVRLHDDVVDRDLTDSEWNADPLMLTVLHDLWMRSYRQLFGADARFWAAYEQCMREWVQATWLSLHPPATLFSAYAAADLLQLAHRGAPLKICVTGACILADTPSRAGPIAAAVDSLLAGAVLFDHLVDWEEDAQSGRFNAFQAYAAGVGASGQPATDRRGAIVRELMIGDGGRPYLQLMTDQLQTAARQADAAGIPELATFAHWLQETATNHAEALARNAKQQLHDAVAPILDAAAATSRGM